MKIPRIQQRTCWIDGDKGRTLWNGRKIGTGDGLRYPRRVRVTDARDLTPEKAVEKVLQKVYSVHDSQTFIEHLARLVGMQAYLADGKVRVRRLEK